MTDLEALFVVLVAVYISQCISWVPPHAFAFSRTFRGRWVAGAPEIAFSGWKIKGVVANPIPFFAGLAIAQPEPVAVTPQGILLPGENAELHAASWHVVPWESIQTFSRQGDWVLADGRRIHQAISPSEARRLRRLLASWKKQGCSWAVLEKEWKRRLDAKAVQERLQELRAATGWVLMFSNALFLLLFGVVPVYIWAGARTVAWINLLFVTLLMIGGSVFTFRKAYRKLYPEEREGLFSETLTIALSPFAAMRARDALTRNLLESFDPLAVTVSLLAKADFDVFAGKTYRQIVFPLPDSPDVSEPIAQEARDLREMRNRCRLAFLKKQVGDLARFVAPPVADSTQSRSYCPRCHAQFRLESGNCSDCRGIALLPLACAADATRVKL